MVLSTSSVEVTCYPAHGFVISSIVDLTRGLELLWAVPGADLGPLSRDLGPAGPASADTFDRGVLAGGWFTMFPTAGPVTKDPSRYMHGELARIAWTIQRSTTNQIRCSVVTPITGFEVTRTVTVQGSQIRVETSAVNCLDIDQEVTFGEHPCFARAVFADGSIAIREGAQGWAGSAGDPSATRLAQNRPFYWPTAEGAAGGHVDVAAIPEEADGRSDHFFVAPEAASLILASPGDGPSVAVSWGGRAQEQVLIWQHYRPAGSPWGESGDVLGIEPMSSPKRTWDEAVASNRTVTVAPRESISYWAALEIS